MVAKVRRRRLFEMRAAPWVVAAGSLLLAGSALGTPWPEADELGEDPRVWRAVRPVVIATGEGNLPRAVAYLRESSELIRKTEANLELDEPTERFRDEARESLEDFDLERFHQLLPEPVRRLQAFRLERCAERGRVPGPPGERRCFRGARREP